MKKLRFLWLLLIPGIAWAAGAGISTWDAMTESAVLADGDLIGITNVSVTTGSVDGTSEALTWLQLKANIKTYADTVYAALAGGTFIGEVIIGDLTVTDSFDGPSTVNFAGATVTVGTDGTLKPTGNGIIEATDLVIASQAAGDILYFDGTNWIRLAIGTAGQVLTVNTGATAPEWATP